MSPCYPLLDAKVELSNHHLIMNAITTYLPWLLSAITITSAILAGNLNRWAWALSAVNQILWFIWIISTATWGFLPMNIALALVFARNHFKWQHAQR